MWAGASPLEHGALFWLAEHAEMPHEHILAKGPVPASVQDCGEELGVDRSPVWSPDGSRLYVANRSEAFVVDVATGVPLWCTGNRVDWLAEWSPDGRYLAHLHQRLLHFRDAATGRPAARPPYRTPGRAGICRCTGACAVTRPDSPPC